MTELLPDMLTEIVSHLDLTSLAHLRRTNKMFSLTPSSIFSKKIVELVSLHLENLSSYEKIELLIDTLLAHDAGNKAYIYLQKITEEEKWACIDKGMNGKYKLT